MGISSRLYKASITGGAATKLISAIHMGMVEKPGSTESPAKGILSAARESFPRRSRMVVKSYFMDGSSFLAWGQGGQFRKSRSFLERLGWRSFRSALASIWRMRSRVTLNSLPTSSRVRL